MAEDVAARHQRALRYLNHRDMALSATCDDLQNRLRRNNVRIFQVPEGSEGGNMAAFIKELLHKVLKIPSLTDIKIARAHRSPPYRPHRDPTAPPRHIIVRFLDAAVKDPVIRQAWSQGQVSFQDKRIFFDQDYSPELHKKRAKVHEVIKQLKKKDILARAVKTEAGHGEKTYTTLSSAAEVLKDLGVEVRCGERERTEDELKDGWRSSERAGHTSLPQHQWGSVTAIVRLLWLIGQKVKIENEWIKHTLKLWTAVKKMFRSPESISRAMPILGNIEFPPSVRDGGFKRWADKGLITINQMFDGTD
ncbi:hypothetical protein F7725_004057, partial [Dissostichus mawsoni]